jgi:protein-tyrosine phosphatase
MNLADLHNHLVPGVDDGSRSVEESLRYLTAMRADGVTLLATSPHLFGWLTDRPGALAARLAVLERGFETLVEVCAGRTDVPELRFSQEILIDSPRMAHAVFGSHNAGLRDTRFALVEFGFDLTADYTDVIRAVLATGRQPIISHPERFRRERVPVTLEEVMSWKDAGALLQVNGGSVLSDYGAAVAALAWRLLESGTADLIASDHHADARVVSPASVYQTIAARLGEGQAEVLMSTNPHRILADQMPLPVSHTSADTAA